MPTGLEGGAVLEPGDESGRVGLDLTHQGGGVAQSHRHLLCRTVRTRPGDGGRNWHKKGKNNEMMI